MKKYVLLVCGFFLLLSNNSHAQKFYEMKFTYGGVLYDAFEVMNKKDIIIRTVFTLDNERYVISSEYKNYTGKDDDGTNFSMLVSMSSPVSLTQNRRQPNMVPCFFYRTWADTQKASKTPMYWQLDRHKLRDPETEKYNFNGKEVTYYKKLKKDDLTDVFLERFMYHPEDKILGLDNSSNYSPETKPQPETSEKENEDDVVYIQEAQYALSKNKDYEAAIASLKKVSPAGQKHRLYVYYAAMAYEGVSNYEVALSNYKKYLNFNPNNTETIDKIAELSYKLHKSDPSGTWKDIKSQPGRRFNVTLTGGQLTIRSEDKKVNISLKYSSANPDGSKHYEGFYKIPLERKFNEASCTICGYTEGLKTYCEMNGSNNTIQVYVKDVNVSLDSYKTSGGKVKYKPCCKEEPFTDYDFLYELEKN